MSSPSGRSGASGASVRLGMSGVSGVALALGFFGVLGCMLLLGILADEIREQEALALDAIATPLLHGLATPVVDTGMRLTTELGSTVLVAPLFALALLVLLWRGDRRHAAFLTVAMVGSIVLNQTLKAVFQRPRPTLEWATAPPEFSFPSGHAMNSLVFYLTIAFLVWSIWGRRPGIAATAAAVVIAAAVGISRIYLGFHYLSDVVAGYLAGFLWLAVVSSLFELAPRLRRRRRP